MVSTSQPKSSRDMSQKRKALASSIRSWIDNSTPSADEPEPMTLHDLQELLSSSNTTSKDVESDDSGSTDSSSTGSSTVHLEATKVFFRSWSASLPPPDSASARSDGSSNIDDPDFSVGSNPSVRLEMSEQPWTSEQEDEYASVGEQYQQEAALPPVDSATRSAIAGTSFIFSVSLLHADCCLDGVLSNPSFWPVAMDNIDTLKPKCWLDLYILDFYLLYHWYQHHARSRVRYVDSFSFGGEYYTDVQRQISRERFRQRYFLPVQGELPHELVAYCMLVGAIDDDPKDGALKKPLAIYRGNHHIVVLQDVSRNCVFLFGLNEGYSASHLHETWMASDGWRRYTEVCDLHGWARPDSDLDVNLRALSPAQNGYDCGIISIQIMLAFYDNSLSIRPDGSMPMPKLSCGHRIRRNVYQELRIIFVAMYQHYCASYQQPPVEWHTWSILDIEVINETFDERGDLQDAIRMLQEDIDVERALDRDVEACSRCKKEQRLAAPSRVHPVRFTVEDHTALDRPTKRTVVEESERTSNLASARHRVGSITNAEHVTAGNDIDEVAVEQEPLSILEETGVEQGLRSMPSDRSRTSHLLSRRVRPHTIMHDERLNANLGPIPIEEEKKALPLPEGQLWIAHDYKFDTYFSGPTKESLRDYEDPIVTFPGNPYAQLTVKSALSRFRDYGYRIEPRFAQMFYLPPPVNVSMISFYFIYAQN